MQVNSIIIVGGGTAGWFTAAALSKLCPEIDITLIEDPDSPTIGVGESTLLSINKFFRSLGMRDKEIAKEFHDRGAIKLYGFIRKNRFKPFTISKNMVRVYAEMAKEKGIPNVLTRGVQKRINRIIKKLYKQRLNQPFKIDVKDYVSEVMTGTDTKTAQAPLPQTPMPKVAVAPQINQQTGLTRTEAALLSPSEQQIARTT